MLDTVFTRNIADFKAEVFNKPVLQDKQRLALPNPTEEKPQVRALHVQPTVVQ